MTENKGLLRGILLGSAVIGAGYYLSKNKDLKEQINTKVKEGIDTFNTSNTDLKKKLDDVVKTAKDSINQTISGTKDSLKDTKISVDDNWAKTSEQVQNVVKRLSNAYMAGKEAARESLKKQDFVHEKVKENLDVKTPSLGATEDTSPSNTNELHPATSNVSTSIGDAGTNFDKLNKDI